MARRWLLLLLGMTVTVQPSSAQSLRAVVLSIGDGDTFRVKQAGRPITVRLACIDAPEMGQCPWGQQARRYLQQQLPIGQEVSLDVKSTDRYGRTVAEVISEININLALVEDGQAFAYRQYLGGCNTREYLDAEVRARRRRYGIWQLEGGITRPWDFRRGRRFDSPDEAVQAAAALLEGGSCNAGSPNRLSAAEWVHGHRYGSTD